MRRDHQPRRMNEMERVMLNEVYRRLVKELVRARASKNEEMARVLSLELAEIEMLLGGGERGISALIGR